MKKIEKYIIAISIIILVFSIIVNVFADDLDIPPLTTKIEVYEQILGYAKKVGVDTSEAEDLYAQAQLLLSSSFADGAGALIDVAVRRLIEGLDNAGLTEEEVEQLMTPNAEIFMEETPSAPISTPTPSNHQSLQQTPVFSDNTYCNNKLGGCSLLMAEKTNINWIKATGIADLRWDIIEREEGIYNWEKIDRFYSNSLLQDINPIINISGIPDWDYTEEDSNINNMLHKLPNREDKYVDFIKIAAERYDGDGFKDSETPIKIFYFQLGTGIESIQDCYGQEQWTDSVENYAKLVRLTKQAINERNPEGKLILGNSSELSSWGKSGETNPVSKMTFDDDGWFLNLLEALESLEAEEAGDDGISKYFDGVDCCHFGGSTDSTVNVNLTYKPIGAQIDLIKKRLSEYGYRDTPIWVTGNSIYTGSPDAYSEINEKVKYCYVSEKEQAIYLVKSIVLSISKGAQGVFWSTFLDDTPGEKIHYGKIDTFYSYSGLLYYDNTPKISFYTYNLLYDVLTGAKFHKNFTGLEENIYGFSFIKDSRPFYIFWNDSHNNKKVQIQAEDGKTYIITSLISSSDGETNEISERADGGLLTFELSDEPVLVRKK